MNDEWSPDEHRLSDAMHDYAAGVQPSAGALAEIRARTSQAPWWRRPATLGVAVAAATAGAVIAITLVVTSPDDTPTPVGASSDSTDSTGDATTASPTPPETASPEESTATPETTPSTAPSTPGSQPDAAEYALPVYYGVVTPDGEPRLAREFHRTQTAEPIADAVRQMIGTADDPDYSTLWNSSTSVVSAALTSDLVVVDIHDPGVTDASAAGQELAVQQLVYTATAAAFAAHGESYATVQVLVDGEPRDVFDAVDLSQPQSREDPLTTRLLVQIDEPLSDGAYTSPVTVRGSGAASEATLEWEVAAADGTVVASDITNTAECCTFSEFSFDVDLEPGDYTVEVRLTDPSGGEGPPPSFDSKSFTVRP